MMPCGHVQWNSVGSHHPLPVLHGGASNEPAIAEGCGTQPLAHPWPCYGGRVFVIEMPLPTTPPADRNRMPHERKRNARHPHRQARSSLVNDRTGRSLARHAPRIAFHTRASSKQNVGAAQSKPISEPNGQNHDIHARRRLPHSYIFASRWAVIRDLHNWGTADDR
jgi:hypothetical protein